MFLKAAGVLKFHFCWFSGFRKLLVHQKEFPKVICTTIKKFPKAARAYILYRYIKKISRSFRKHIIMGTK